MTVRRLMQADLPAVAAIQDAAPDAAHWKPEDYLERESYVAETGSRVAGFLILLPLGEGEAEILNIAVAPEFTRRGVGRALLAQVLDRTLHLEVRASNTGAIAFYQALGFVETGRRRAYYASPREDAILMSNRPPGAEKPSGEHR